MQGYRKTKYALLLHKWIVQIGDGRYLRAFRVLRYVARRGETGRRKRGGRERGQGIGLDEVRAGGACAHPLVGESELARESEMACFGVFHLLEIYIRK
jgi:hypothetical protein